MIEVTPNLLIYEDELVWKATRASGPGGQHVNKTSTAIELRFDAQASPSLPEDVRHRLIRLAGSRATLAEFNLDRHWRNARVHTLHDPVRWKYHAIGAYRLNGTLPARHSWI